MPESSKLTTQLWLRANKWLLVPVLVALAYGAVFVSTPQNTLTGTVKNFVSRNSVTGNKTQVVVELASGEIVLSRVSSVRDAHEGVVICLMKLKNILGVVSYQLRGRDECT